MIDLEKQHIDHCHELAKEWLRHHVASCRATGDILDLEWSNPIQIEFRRPDTWNYATFFIIFRNTIIVTGDLGEAVYGFGQNITFAKLQKMDWHYFTGKCCASETGRQYIQKIKGIKAPVTNIRAIAHFVGLQMAIKQLLARPQP